MHFYTGALGTDPLWLFYGNGRKEIVKESSIILQNLA